VSRIEEALAVLEGSSARLEYGKALATYGSVLRRAGQRSRARDPLRRAADIAVQCCADPLAKYARTELLAAGGRPRHTEVTGLATLTASEHRVAEMAAAQATNREIAQALFVTPKTIEVHLGNVYRKLGITSRADLPDALLVSNP
jgi:DNA-binding CsgD family transcriptional regulator